MPGWSLSLYWSSVPWPLGPESCIENKSIFFLVFSQQSWKRQIVLVSTHKTGFLLTATPAGILCNFTSSLALAVCSHWTLIDWLLLLMTSYWTHWTSYWCYKSTSVRSAPIRCRMTFVFSTVVSQKQLTAKPQSSKMLQFLLCSEQTCHPLSMHQYSWPSAFSCANHDLFCTNDVARSVPSVKTHALYITETVNEIRPTSICTSHTASFLRRFVLGITRFWVHHGKMFSSQRTQPPKENGKLNYRSYNTIHKLILIKKYG